MKNHERELEDEVYEQSTTPPGISHRNVHSCTPVLDSFEHTNCRMADRRHNEQNERTRRVHAKLTRAFSTIAIVLLGALVSATIALMIIVEVVK